jgi:hypothetical protein
LFGSHAGVAHAIAAGAEGALDNAADQAFEQVPRDLAMVAFAMALEGDIGDG